MDIIFYGNVGFCIFKIGFFFILHFFLAKEEGNANMERDREDEIQSKRQSVADLAKKFQHFNNLTSKTQIPNRIRSKSNPQQIPFNINRKPSTPTIPLKPEKLRSYYPSTPSISSIQNKKEAFLTLPTVTAYPIDSDSNTNASVSSQDGQAITKRERIIDEIYETEKTFLNDMNGER
jgi:hypothetical protein